MLRHDLEDGRLLICQQRLAAPRYDRAVRALLSACVPVIAAVLLAGCADDPDLPCFSAVLEQHSAELKACQAGDVCILAQSTGCHCFGAYNASAQDRFDEFRSESMCGGTCGVSSCIGQQDPRCEGGVCVSDDFGTIDAGADASAAVSSEARALTDGLAGGVAVESTCAGLRRGLDTDFTRLQWSATCLENTR